MRRSDLMRTIYDEFRPAIDYPDAERAVLRIFETITEALEQGHRVELRGFAAFSVKSYDPRIGRNPRTGEVVNVPKRNHVRFRCSKTLQQQLMAPNEDRPEQS